MTTSKYKAVKTTINGITFDSKKEAKRYRELSAMQDGGIIHNLQLQVKYQLIPPQRIEGKLIERECSYIADFVYTSDGHTVVEDTKGFRTDTYRIKRKLMLKIYGIRIKEI